MVNTNTSLTNCSDDFPFTEEYYKELSDNGTLLALYAVCAFVCCVLIGGFLEYVWHYMKLLGDDKRYKQVYLLGLYPVVASLSFLAIAVPRSTILTDLLASVYLSAAIYQFISITILYHGGTRCMLSTMQKETVSFCAPPLCFCLCCFRTVPFTRRTLTVLRIMVLQIVIIQPILLLLAAILWTNDQYTPGNTSTSTPTLYITILNTASTLFAMYGLIVTFGSSKVRLKEERLGLKFAALQIAIIIISLQNIAVLILAKFDIPACVGTRGSKVRGSNFNHMLLIVEMLLLGGLARFAYHRSLILTKSSNDTRPVNDLDNTAEESQKVTDNTAGVNHNEFYHPYAFQNTAILTDEISVRL